MPSAAAKIPRLNAKPSKESRGNQEVTDHLKAVYGAGLEALRNAGRTREELKYGVPSCTVIAGLCRVCGEWKKILQAQDWHSADEEETGLRRAHAGHEAPHYRS